MSSIYNGNPANGARSPAVSPTIPGDGDAGNVASVNAALQELADQIAWLQANTPGLSEANTFTQNQVMQAILTLSGAGSILALTAAALQAISKSGGKLQVGTTDNNDLELFRNNSVMAALVSGAFDVKTNRIANVGAPTATGDALPRGATDGLTITGPASGGAGVNGTGNAAGASPGVKGTGGTGGVGVLGQGAGNAGGQFTGGSSNIGVVGIGGSGAQGGWFQNGSPSAPVKGTINLQVVTAAPSNPSDGDLWVENIAGTWHIKVRMNGVTSTIV